MYFDLDQSTICFSKIVFKTKPFMTNRLIAILTFFFTIRFYALLWSGVFQPLLMFEESFTAQSKIYSMLESTGVLNRIEYLGYILINRNY